jgi:hypothetical protein
MDSATRTPPFRQCREGTGHVFVFVLEPRLNRMLSSPIVQHSKWHVYFGVCFRTKKRAALPLVQAMLKPSACKLPEFVVRQDSRSQRFRRAVELNRNPQRHSLIQQAVRNWEHEPDFSTLSLGIEKLNLILHDDSCLKSTILRRRSPRALQFGINEPDGHHSYLSPSLHFRHEVFALMGQVIERKARRKEVLFTKSVELAKANRDFIAMVADKTGQSVQISDYAVYAEMYYWILTELHDKGSLPENWRQEIQREFGQI